MQKIVFVAPYFMEATLRFVRAAARVPDCRLALVSCDPADKLPPDLKQALAAHYAVRDTSTEQLLHGVQQVGRQLGGIDALLGMLEQIQVSLGEIRDALGLRGMGAAAARNFRDKALMKTVLREAGVPCARHRAVTTVEAGMAFAAGTGFPLIVKPLDGAGAKGTFRCETAEQLQECLRHSRPSEANVLVLEEFIQGKERSFDSVCLDGKILWSSISHYFPGPLEVVREPWIQWCVMIPREADDPQSGDIRGVAQQALTALGMETGLSHMEWFLREDGSLAVSEVGCRPPGAQFTSLISWAHDFDLYQAWADVLIHQRFQAPERKFAAGAAYLRGMGRGRVTAVHGLDRIAKDFGGIVVEASIPKPGMAPTGSYEGEGHILVRHPETEVVKEALRRIVSTVRVELREDA